MVIMAYKMVRWSLPATKSTSELYSIYYCTSILLFQPIYNEGWTQELAPYLVLHKKSFTRKSLT